MALHYYAQKQYYKNGVAQTPVNYPYTDRNAAEKQFYLLCASAIGNTDQDFASIEWGTIEQGKIDRKFYRAPTPEPEPEPEPEPTPEDETTSE